ncbi:MAG: DUF4136 domain-containing protein [Planctomycetota bacterium]
MHAKTLSITRIGSVAVALVGLAGCNSTVLTNSWAAPDAGPITFQKIAVVCIAEEGNTRRTAEDAMVRQIHRAEAVPAYQLIPDAQLRDAGMVQQRLADAGFDGAMTVRIVDVRREVTYVPESYPSHYRRFGGYYGEAWGGSYRRSPSYVDEVVQIETNIYLVENGKLIWGGTSESFNPGDIETLMKDLAVTIAADLRERGLLPQEEADAAQP